MPSIILVDDELNALKSLVRACRNACIAPQLGAVRVTPFVSARDALAHLALRPVDVVVADFRMPEMDGIEMLARIRELQPDAARIVLSGPADRNDVILAIGEAGVGRFLARPWDDVELKQAIVDVLAERAEALATRPLADEARSRGGPPTPNEIAPRERAAQSPGITGVLWRDDGGVLVV